MGRRFKKILLWIYLKIHLTLVNISIALYNTEEEILKADPFDLKEGDKKIQRMRHRNQVLEKFYAGKRDEKYVQDFYEILKGADKFMKNSTQQQFAVATDKHLRFTGKDESGRRYDTYGYFDNKHKHAGKTLGEVLALEFEERRTKDDNYDLLYIFENQPIEVGLAKIMDVVEKTDKTIEVPEVIYTASEDGGLNERLTGDKISENIFEVKDNLKKSQSFEFPIKAFRDDENIVNKIEQLADCVHVKQTAFEYRQLEFFIPVKYKTEEITEDSQIFLDLINIKGIFVKNKYGEIIGFGITKFIKRMKHNSTHEVWKFDGIEMQNVGLF